MPNIELNAPRLISIEDRGKPYSLTLRRIAKKDWLRYFEGILSTSENQSGKRVDSFDSSAARLALIDDCLIGASGYTLPQGSAVGANGGGILNVEGWRALLPLSHRLGAANAVIAVSQSDPKDEDAIALGVESVFLDAVWSADADGVMRKFHGLRHNFKVPTAEQQRRISRDSSRSRVVGGSRNGKTLWLGAQPTLAELYDELIVSVEGYDCAGESLADSPEKIAEWMDTYHKVAAVDVLFAPAAPKVEEDGD
jgi:hypothetical protein